MVKKTDISLINKAVQKAWKYQILTYPNPAVGAVISDDAGNIISFGVHKKAGFLHAEVDAIKEAYYKLTLDSKIQDITNPTEIHEYLIEYNLGIFKDLNIHITLEPCNHHGKTPPCSHLIKKLGFKRVVVGMLDCNEKASGGVGYLRDSGICTDVLEHSSECEALLLPFKKWQKENFIFFKLAMSLNGVIDGGIITTVASRKRVHMFRDKIDLLVIGGNTVRVDRPLLDARMSEGRAPDVLIYSKSREFDKTIPLFGVKNRKVYIEDNFEILNNYKLIMIEGGEGMLRASRDFVDMFAIFRSSNFKTGKNINFELKLKELSHEKITKDTLSWYEKI